MKKEGMSAYEARRWDDLEKHWVKKASRRELMPAKVRAASEKTREVAVRAGAAVANATPDSIKEFGLKAADAALVPAVEGIVHTIELVNDWAVELTDPEKVLEFHRGQGRDVMSLADLRHLDLAEVDEAVRRLVLKWRSFGAAEGAALGALAMVPVMGGAIAITADLAVMQILATAIATRVCYAYGFDAKDPELQHVVQRMVARSFRGQLPKAQTARCANLASAAAKGRKNWSKKLRNDHRILAALEKLMKQWGGVSNVPVSTAARGLPVVAVVASTGTNAAVMGDVAKQARLYAQTLFLAEKYDLPLPANLAKFPDPDDESDGGDDSTGVSIGR
jgi:EcsC family protein